MTLDELKSYILNNFTEAVMTDKFDDEIINGNWIDYDLMEEDELENEFEYYDNYGRGEAEEAVIEQVFSEIEFDLNIEISDDDKYELSEFLKENFSILEHF